MYIGGWGEGEDKFGVPIRYIIKQECGKTLTNKLYEDKKRVEMISKKLDYVKEQLAKFEETEKCLKRRVDYLETTRAKRDCEQAEWRLMEVHLLAELGDSRLAEDQLREALCRLDDEARLVEQSVVENTNELHAEISKLTDELAARQTVEGVLQARVSEMEVLLCTEPETLPDQSSFFFMDLDKDLRDRCLENRMSLDESSSLELGRGDDGQKSISSPSVDEMTYDQKPISRLSVVNSELIGKYLYFEELDVDDDDFQKPPTVPDLHTVELIRKHENREKDALDDVVDHSENLENGQ